MKVGNVVRWSPSNSHSRIGIVLSYNDYKGQAWTGLWYVWFPNDGCCEIEEWCLEVISEI